MKTRKQKTNLLTDVCDCFQQKLADHGATPEGVYWNSVAAQETRFAQLLKIIDKTDSFSIIDYGCGYGALIDYLERLKFKFDYTGFDIAGDMLEKGRSLYADRKNCAFVDDEYQLTMADYLVESGIFNLKLDVAADVWTEHVLDTLNRMNELANKGFAFNMLTKYSDSERMRSDLYYADPCFFFDYCKKNYSRNIALLHDYEIYDFTVLVRK